jgi:hypothetical protein
MISTCLRCGSNQMARGIPLRDHYGDVGNFSKDAAIKVHGEPQAWLFKDTVAGKLLADLCGDCGHVELRAENFRELYEKHVKSGAVEEQ